MIKKRDPKIDILRFIGLMGIILAHTRPSNVWLAELRNFDVVLISLMLGASFYVSNANKTIDYLSYIKKRFTRLVVATWIFLSIFFILFYMVAIINHDKYYFNFRQIIGSYTLMDGIGYVWIMRVFFSIALISPLLLTMDRKIKNNLQYFGILTAGYLVYFLLLLISGYINGTLNLIYVNYIVFGFGFCLIAAFGIRLPNLGKVEVNYYCLLFFSIFLLLTLYDHLSPTQLQSFKYPPKLYYISYGMFVSLLLYRLLDFKPLERLFENRFVKFVSYSSAWLYFWHIIPVYIIILFGRYIPFIANNSLCRFAFILLTALTITYLHNYIKARNKIVTN